MRLDRENHRAQLGRVMRAARERAGVTQADLGFALAPLLGEEVPQTTLSRWEVGGVELSVRQFQAVEAALGLAPGVLFAAAGVVNLDKAAAEIEWLIRSDPHLHPSVRNEIADCYVAMVKVSAEIASHAARTRRRR